MLFFLILLWLDHTMAQAFVSLHASEYPKVDCRSDSEDGGCEFDTFIDAAICEHGGKHTSRVTQEDVLSVSGKEKPVAKEFLNPSLLLWNPTLQFPDLLLEAKCPKCKRGALYQLPFEKHHSQRIIHDSNEELILTSPLYVCQQSKEHIFAGFHPLILDILPSRDLLPFVLFHKTGVTRQLFQFIVNSVTSGMSFNEIESKIVEQFWHSHAMREHIFRNAVKSYISSMPNGCEDEDFPFPPFNREHHPSNDLVTSCFLIYFVEHEQYFTNCMVRQTASEWISLDHTFKVATNIGLHDPDGRWAKQFSSLMCVLNESGKVLSWKLTKGESFDHIEEMLLALKARHYDNSVILKGACIDNCCTWRNKLQGVFGDNFIVVLDLFHAIQRVTKKIPKKHILRSECVKDLRLVFRSPEDQGTTRKMDTPREEVMEQNLKDFIQKWKDAKSESGVPILNAKAIKECTKLQKHVRKGCLSGIPPHISTSRNERLHRTLKSQVINCKLGVATAVAILTVVFYRHNTRESNVFCGAVQPILVEKTSEVQMPASNEKFGIGFFSSSEDYIYNTSWNNELCDTSTISASIQGLLVSNECNTDQIQVVNTCLAMKFFDEQMAGIGSEYIPFETSFIPFLPTVLTVINHDELHSQYGSLVNTKTNGLLSNCFKPLTESEVGSLLDAIATHISFLSHQPEYSEYISHLGCVSVMNQSDVKSLLMVNCANLVNVNGEEQLQLLSDCLGTVFAVITKCHEFPIIPVFPEKRIPHSPLLCLYYCGADGYLAVSLQRSDKESSEVENRETFCTCGKTHKTAHPKCVRVEGKKYPCRCKCFLNGLACSAQCQCDGCQNPNGARPQSMSNKQTSRRKRFPHHSQVVLDSIEKGLKFMVSNQEVLTLGAWTKTEHFLFEAVIAHLKKGSVDVSLQVVLALYNSICTRLIQLSPVPLSLSSKSELQVKSKMVVHDKVLARFQEKYKQVISSLFTI